MSSVGAVGALLLMILIAAVLLGLILYLNSIGAYNGISITPTVNTFLEVIAIFIIALVAVVVLGRR
jgi:hypothetical protein